MAKRGGQPGNNNATKNKPWAEALRKRALTRKSLERIADKLLDMAEGGDMDAIKELGDRIDGKPTQAIAGDADNPLAFELIKRVIVRTDD